MEPESSKVKAVEIERKAVDTKEPGAKAQQVCFEAIGSDVKVQNQAKDLKPKYQRQMKAHSRLQKQLHVREVKHWTEVKKAPN